MPPDPPPRPSSAPPSDAARRSADAAPRPAPPSRGFASPSRSRSPTQGGRRQRPRSAAVMTDSAAAAVDHSPSTAVTWSFGSASDPGARPYMEDRHTVVAPFGDDGRGAAAATTHATPTTHRAFVGIFDGHSGPDAAITAAARLPDLVLACHAALVGSTDDGRSTRSPARGGDRAATHPISLDGDPATQPPSSPNGTRAAQQSSSPNGTRATQPPSSPNGTRATQPSSLSPIDGDQPAVPCYASALAAAFRRVDAEILTVARSHGGRQGATAVVALCDGARVWTAHAGDSRAVLARAGGAVAHRLTDDHKPNRAAERARVLAAGGAVEWQGCWRVVCGARGGRPAAALAVSRSLGDLDFKEPLPLVVADPDVALHVLGPADDFIVLASDGLWDVLSDQAAVDIAAAALRRAAGDGQHPPTAAAGALVRAALARRSGDNVTVVVGVCGRGGGQSGGNEGG